MQFEYPRNYFWEDPGFPAICFSYGRSSDFFFSGNAGFSALAYFEWKELGNEFLLLIIQVIILGLKDLRFSI